MNDIENNVNENNNNENNNEQGGETNGQNPFVPATEGVKEENSTVADEKFVFNETTITAALSYLSILVLVPFFMKKDNPFIMFHVKQGLVLLGIAVISYVLNFLPMINFLVIVLNLFILALSLIGLYNVFLQKTIPLPLVGKLSDKIDV